MGQFVTLVIDVSPGRRRETLAPAPELAMGKEQQGLTEFFNRCLEKDPQRFRSDLLLPEQRKIELEFASAGQWAGVVFWQNNDHTPAVSILLHTLISFEDLRALTVAMADRGFTLPKQVAQAVENENNRPLLVTLFYSHKALRFRPLLTMIRMFAMTFFARLDTGRTRA